ncbi:MAG: TolB family protein, partial [Bacteroidota bacterium]
EPPILFERAGKIFAVEEGKKEICLTEGLDGEARSPAWDPERRKWAFLLIKPGESQIWIRKREGGQLYVGTCPDTSRDLTWGNLLYFTYTQFGRGGTVQLIRKRGAFSGVEQDLLAGAIESHPSWANGKLVWSRGRQGPWQVWIANDTGDDPRALIEGHCAEPQWSPDGTRIAYSSNRSGAWEIYITEATSRSTNRVTHSPKGGWARQPAWSPEGDRLVFEANWRPSGELTQQSNLLTIPTTGGTASLIVEDGHHPAW